MRNMCCSGACGFLLIRACQRGWPGGGFGDWRNRQVYLPCRRALYLGDRRCVVVGVDEEDSDRGLGLQDPRPGSLLLVQ